jgi:hypothetical protein
VALRDIMQDMSKEFAAKMDSKARDLIAMQDYVQDMNSEMCKLTKDVNMLKDTRDKASIII